MKCLLIVETVILATALQLGAEISAPESARTFIPSPLEAPVFNPPAPPVGKKFAPMRVDSSIIVPAGNFRTITLIRGEASTLPDIPVPPKPIPQEPQKLTPEQRCPTLE